MLSDDDEGVGGVQEEEEEEGTGNYSSVHDKRGRCVWGGQVRG